MFFFTSACKIYAYVDQGVSTLGSYVWHVLPSNTKSATSFSSLKTLLKMWFCSNTVTVSLTFLKTGLYGSGANFKRFAVLVKIYQPIF